MKIAVIGIANVDITAKAQGDFVMYDSNPGKITIAFGGVGRNIAHNLALLGEDVTFFSCFGGDSFAKAVIEDCKRIGFHLDYCEYYEEERSSIYLCINNKEGDLVAGSSDMDLANYVNQDYIEKNLEVLNTFDAVVIDSDFEADTIAYVMDHVKVPVFMDGVSATKVKRIGEALKKAKPRDHFVLKCNQYEAESLTQIVVRDDDSAVEACLKLAKMGFQDFIISRGEQGATIYRKGIIYHGKKAPKKIVNTTGCGDSFFAGMTYGYLRYYSVENCLNAGFICANETMTSNEPVNEHLKEIDLNKEIEALK